MIEIWTDGACLPRNPGPGGAAWVIKTSATFKSGKRAYKHTTNNRMELMAVILALCEVRSGYEVTIYSDSQYFTKAVNLAWLSKWKRNDWKTSEKKKVKNVDLWKEIDRLFQEHPAVHVEWIPRLSCAGQREADKLANDAATSKEIKRWTDTQYEKTPK